MTREEALNTIAVVLQHTQTDCDYAYDNADGSVDFLPGQDIADALRLALAALREQEERRWIPVTERLPELETPVLISLHRQNDVFARVGWLHESGMWSVPTTRSWLNDGITHWMPLPEPPKEG